MSQLKENQAQDGLPSSNRKMCYFYVVIPPEDQAASQDCSKAISSKEELTAIMKRNPRARFQSANTPEEAYRKALDKIQFAKEAESISKPKNDEITQKKKGRQSFSAVEESIGAPAVESPKTGELLLTGREITTKQNDKVFAKISKNPRILCTDTEFPTILQEGCKYNALHLAAKSNNFEVMQRVLDLVSCIDFLRQIYPRQSEKSLTASLKHLVTSYLNNPDKMMLDTPLHFACKFNSVECVELLLSHPLCDTSLKNFDKHIAFEEIGSRDNTKGAKAQAIRKLFSDRYIVPIWRDLSVDGEAPVLGKVSFITDLGADMPQPLLHETLPNFSLSLLEPCKAELLPHSTFSECAFSALRVFAKHPSNWKIRAFAGPMTEAKATEFRQVMKRSRGFLFGYTSFDNSLNTSLGCGNDGCETPPQSPNVSQQSKLRFSPIISPRAVPANLDAGSFLCSPMKAGMDLRVRDVEKGLERIGLEYCKELGIPWSEYWQVLGKFCDFSTEAGIDLLEAHFHALQMEKREEEVEDLITSVTSNGSADLEHIISKFRQMRLNSSGIISPQRDLDGFCTNTRCRMNARFCNCVAVVPAIPYGDDDHCSWSDDNVDDGFREAAAVPSCAREMRDTRRSSSTDSRSFSFGAIDEFEFGFPFDWSDLIHEEYKTAPSSPLGHEDEVFEDCSNTCLYLSGDDRPGKFDYQIFNLLNDFNDQIDSSKHLQTFQWLNSMRAHGNSTVLGRSRFNISRNGGSTPRRLWEPSFASTPRRVRSHSGNIDDDDEDEEDDESIGFN